MKNFRTHPASIIFLYIAMLSFFISCSDDDNKDGTTTAEELVYEQIQKAVNSSSTLTLDDIVTNYYGTTITFSDKSKVEIKKAYNIHIIDISSSNEPTITKNSNNTWTINGKNSGIAVASASDKTLKIMCVAYNDGFAMFYTNDGNKFKLERTGVGKIYLFKLEAEHNEGLDADVNATIRTNDKTISLAVPYNFPTNSLTATFSYHGESVKIGETEQISGVTKNNFNEPLVYSITTNQGTKIDYTVTVTHKLPRIPIVYVNTDGGATINDKENYVRMTVKVEDKDEVYTDGQSFSATAGIRGRGNSTWNEPKKPYRMKLDNKASLLGMSNDKDWALLANHLDKTLLRNITAFQISRIAGMSWTPGSISVDFYLNGNYQGVYTLTEHVKVAKERLNMTLVTPSDNAGEALTGGYFLELDFHADEDHFRTAIKDLPIMYKDPDAPTEQQKNFLKNYFDTAEGALYSANFTDPDTGYRKYIDMESFINYYIIQELAKNVDGNMRGSCYLAIRRNGKIEQPLVWDFDLAFGNADHITWEQGASSAEWDGWYLKTCAPWFDQFFKDPEFVSALKKRWNELKPQLNQLPNYIKERAASLDDSQKRNFGPKTSGGAGWDVTEKKWNTSRIRGSYASEVDYLVSFVEKRLQWLDTNINAL
ncbi:MAG: CotH kinase family protein [Dysgonomonas sp.]